MDALVRHFSDLKFALQELESAVQEPRDGLAAAGHILYDFPAVMSRFIQILSELLGRENVEVGSLQEIFTIAHARGWLKGDLNQWLLLVQSYEALGELDLDSPATLGIAQHIRDASFMLWQTYECLTQRFRWQTSVVGIPASLRGPSAQSHQPLHCA